MTHPYQEACDALLVRVRELANHKPDEFRQTTSPSEMLKLGLKCSDIQPSYAQAAACWGKVMRERGWR